MDPDDESVLLFRPNQSPRGLKGPDLIDVADVLPCMELSVQHLFDSLLMG